MIPVIGPIVSEDAIHGEPDSTPEPVHQSLFLRNVRTLENTTFACLVNGTKVIL